MPTGRLILLLLLIVAAAVVVVLVLRRGSAQRDEQRVEAAEIRGEAEGMAATVTGQDTFAQQAEERAEVARLEAEERAREAARLEAEAAEQRAAAEATRREYEATMRRADDVDPDVKESAFAPVPEPGEATDGDGTPDAGSAVTPDAGSHVAQDAPDARSDASDAGDTEQVLLSRAERRQAREHEGESPWAAPSGPGAVAAGAAAAGAAGASTWAARDEEDASPESRRIASAADYRDEVPDGDTGAGSSTEVYERAPAGSGAAMTQDSRQDDDRVATDDLSQDTQSPSGEWGGPRADAGTATGTASSSAARGTDDDVQRSGEPGDAAIVSDTDAFASTEPLPVDEQTPPVEPVAPATTEAAEGERTAADDGADRDRTTGDETADRDRTTGDETTAADAGAGESTSRSADDEDHRTGGGEGDLQIVSDTDAYASTEPLQASEAEPAPTDEIDSDRTDAGDRTGEDVPGDADRADGHDERTEADRADAGHAPAETGAAVAETSEADTDRSTSDDVAAGVTEERHDPTPTRDWAADEGDLLAESRDRGDRLADDRQDLEAEDDRLSGIAAQEAATASGTASDDVPAEADDAVDQAAGRRVSEFDELRDGGYGVGSAAPLDDGAQPLDHPVQGYRDSMTFRAPGDAGYDSAEPDVWFYDEAAAERSGFRRGDG